MNRSGERRSSFRSAVTALALALALASLGARAHAEAPSCGWGDGVVLPGGDTRSLMITDDGGSGVIAIVWPFNIGFSFVSELRFYHVLEQGKLDPSMPATGVPFLTGPDLPSRPEFTGIRALPDGAGGAYVLFRACNSTMPHLRCWENSEVRLLRVTSQGAVASGWPATGLLLDITPTFIDPGSDVDLVPAGSDVIAVWVGGSASSVQAQRFAPDGSTLWPGGLTGVTVLGPLTMQDELRVMSDHAGGCVFVAVDAVTVSGSITHTELRAGRVTGTGALPWGVAGKPVITQPAYSASNPGLAVDELGRSFVTAWLVPTGSASRMVSAQLLSAAGTRAWGIFGITLGPGDGSRTEALAIPAGFVSLRTDGTGTPRYQLQDEFGTAQWGDGVAADWTTPPSLQRPLATPDGHVISVWTSQAAPPDSGIRALELDEAGDPVAGWPASGALVCGGLPGNYLEDAMIADGNLFVAMASAEMSGVAPRVQRLSRAVLSAPPARPVQPLEFAPPAPNPARGAWLARVALREAGSLTIEAFDVAGRRALAADLGVLAPGWHVLDVPGSGALAPGVYRVRVRTAEHVAERVLVKLR